MNIFTQTPCQIFAIESLTKAPPSSAIKLFPCSRLFSVRVQMIYCVPNPLWIDCLKIDFRF